MASSTTEKSGMVTFENSEAKSATEHIQKIDVPSVPLAAALAEQKPRWLSRKMIQLYLVIFIGYLVSSLNGYDGSLMGGINATPQYQSTFGLDGAGSGTGIVFISYNLGNIAAIPFCALIGDTWGRRWCIFAGCIVVVIGTIVQATSQIIEQYIGGRFVLGLGTALACSSAPAYVVELSHPAARGVMAGMYNNFWWLGNIAAGWTIYGTNRNLSNNWAWRLPTVLQGALPLIVMTFIMFLPESPRWLIAQDRGDKAEAILAKYHGDGDRNAPIVKLQMAEITQDLRDTTSDKPWWNFTDLVSTRAKRYRFAMVVLTAFFGQWSGNAVVTYFLPEMMKLAGITEPNKQLLINATLSFIGMISAVVGATTLDWLGRRKAFLFSLLGCLFSYVFLTVFTATSTRNANLAYGTIVFVFLYIVFFAWGFTPLQTLYAVECLENRTRMKGSAQNFFWLNVALMVNTYGVSVGIEKLGWKLYLVFIIWICIELLVIYFFFVETKSKTLEELKVIFEARNPVKESLMTSKVMVDAHGSVVRETSSA